MRKIGKENPFQGDQPEYTVDYSDNGDGRTLVRIKRDDGEVISCTVPSEPLMVHPDTNPEQPVEPEVT